eukprot:356368-Chlamydomonas_euryale.AAC.2
MVRAGSSVNVRQAERDVVVYSVPQPMQAEQRAPGAARPGRVCTAAYAGGATRARRSATWPCMYRSLCRRSNARQAERDLA